MEITPKTKVAKRLFVFVVLALLLTTAVSTTTAAPAEHDEYIYHTVKYGEYLGNIAYHYGVSVHDILEANPHIHNPNLIYYGTVLAIPTGHTGIIVQPQPVPSCRYHHYVRYGENLSSLGAWYGVSPYRIAEVNHIYNLNHIYSGQYLCIP